MSLAFGSYETLHELKTGGMGAVLLARRRGPGAFEQLVAVKTIRAEFAHAPSVRAMFLDEAAILARLSHPGIARVYDFGEDGGTLYMVMEYVAGVAFRDLAELGAPPVIVARAIAEAARGLHAAHEARDLRGSDLGLVHRDISPDNLMLGFDGHVKVIDFGIALVKGRQAPVTEFGTVKGKPPYMSPEQVKNEAIDRRSDVFSLAVVAHELLSGKPLFDGDSIYAVARAVEHMPIPLPSAVRGEALPLGLDAVVMNALERDVARRTPTAAAFAADLEEVLAVASGESLGAWTERRLGEMRADHRRWLSSVVDGASAPNPPIGRPTGAVTAMGPDLHGPPPVATPPVAPDVPEHAAPQPTHVVADDADPILARRSRVPLVLGVLLLLGLGVAIFAVTRTREASVVAALAADAGAVPVAIDAPGLPVDAPSPIEAPPDAAPPLDAPPVLRDAGRPARDAAPIAPRDATVPLTVPRDAAPPAPPDAAVPMGSGFVSVFHRAGGTYLQVVIDGKPIGPTPLVKRKLAAGKHTVQLLAPDTSQTVVEQGIDVADGQHVTVRQP